MSHAACQMFFQLPPQKWKLSHFLRISIVSAAATAAMAATGAGGSLPRIRHYTYSKVSCLLSGPVIVPERFFVIFLFLGALFHFSPVSRVAQLRERTGAGKRELSLRVKPLIYAALGRFWFFRSGKRWTKLFVIRQN